MGCGSSKKAEPPPERRIRISEAHMHAMKEEGTEPVEAPAQPRSTVIAMGRSVQDGLMAEQESFAKSLPNESRSILNATMANMLDLGQANASPSDYIDREPFVPTFNDEMPMARPARKEVVVPSLGNVRNATPEEAQEIQNIANILSVALKSVHVRSEQSIIQPFLPIP